MADIFFKYIFLLLVLSTFQSNCSAAQADTTKDSFNDYYNKAWAFKNVNTDSAIFYAQKAFSFAKEKNDFDKEFDLYILLIRAYKQIGKYATAIEKSQEAQKLIDRFNLQNKQSKLLMWIGNVYYSMGFSSKALEYLYKASKLSPPEGIKKEILYYTGLVQYSLGEIKKSRQLAHQCIATRAKKNNLIADVNSYVLLSNTYSNPDSIAFFLDKAYQIAADNPDLLYNKVVILNNQALLYDMVGKKKARNQKFIEAIKIAKQNNFASFLPELYNNYSYALMEEGKFKEAKSLLDTSLIISTQNKALDIQASLLDTYSDLYKEMGDYGKSLEYLRKSIHKRAAYRKQQQAQTSLFLSAVFESQKKEKELLMQEAKLSRFRLYLLITAVLILLLVIIILYFRQRLFKDKVRMETLEREKTLEVADAIIKGQDEERKRLAMDLHDGLGARLGALKLKVDTVLFNNPNYYDLTSAIDDIARNVRELSHRMLPSRLSEIGLIQSLKNLIRSVNASSSMKVEFETNVEHNLDDKIQVHLYYLIYELINNAIKHSHGKTLFIQLFISDESLTLSAEDDGVGFDTSAKGEGHGLANIRQRVEYLNGKLLIESEEGRGSEFMIEIPMA